ncbi:alpha/beta fold hydrolase [Marinitenerispora sediminis]|uniref:Alpha/beta hydrolase n=1 Tax=Marinitenerispora sediminis TaxID=1931232 RepID=A0A368T5M7_9ACTN|nr:alpha/beta hydrolase [Marinitenerispora sediminis]RCV48231.1 alpha/beta hydrolase [Marinitenerispora sediminis]RCV49345.1 alpha/beta hydrolase [Marinitenerispora sediminis]RCV58682.1 alpha/beta hydrolase [Marinitenerispora sediminis]
MNPWNIVYDRRGAGTPVVLLHGLGHSRRAWDPVVDALAARHDVVSVDLPGFGQSPWPAADAPYDIPALVRAVSGLCDYLGLRRPHLVGNSLGGAIALELGALGAAGSVTAFSPIGFSPAGETYGRRLLAFGAGLASRVPEPVRLAAADSPPARAVARRVLRGADADPASVRDLRFDATMLAPGSPFLRLAAHVAGYVYAAPGLACPVTIGWGDLDRVLPVRAARRAGARIPHARHVRLLGCGHVPMYDNPVTVGDTILDTCRAAEVPAGGLAVGL